MAESIPAEPDTADIDVPKRRDVPRWVRALLVLVLAVFMFILGGLFSNAVTGLKELIFGPSIDVASSDVTLMEIKATAELRAATGTFSVPVYLEDPNNDGLRSLLPESLTAESAVALYQGSVDALVDLQALSNEDVDADPEEGTLHLVVPAPQLTEPNIDEAASHIVSQDRGLLPRIDDFLGDTPNDIRDEMDDAAIQALTEAAEESTLREDAEANAREFLEGLGHNLGYTDVTVEFVDP